jgi:alpha-glucosidase
MLAFTREVLALRKAHDALLLGDMIVIEASDDLLVFERGQDDEHMICAFNFAACDNAWQPPQPGRWQIVARSLDGDGWNLPALSGFVARRIA